MNDMKKIFSIIYLSLFIFFFVTPSALAKEIINHFDSQIIINQDTSLSILEEIDYTTDVSKHGIYRYIPVSYNQDGTKVKLPISNIKVTDESGNKIPYSQTTDNKNITLKIGDEEITFLGEQTYIISYRVQNALRKFDDHDELYWDITGEGWQVDIASTSTTISSPFATIKKVTCLSGNVGGNDHLCQSSIEDGNAVFGYDQAISYGDNLTIALSLDQNNQLAFPTQNDQYLSWIKLNWPIILIPLPTLILFLLWYKKGRNIEFLSANVYNLDPNKPARHRPINFFTRTPFVYQPIEQLSAGEAGALIDGRVDNQDVIAEILELARKKYLKIESIQTKKLFNTKTDYQFIKINNGTKPLTKAQSFLLEKIFKNKKSVKVSELKGTFYLVMNQAKQMITKSLVEKKIYTKDPNQALGLGIATLVISTVALLFLFIMLLFPWGIIWPIAPLILQFPIGFIFALNMPQKSAVGTNLYLQTKGLKQSIKYGKWREKIKEKNLFIEEVLPFAVSLGVVNQLAKEMEKLNIKPPEYIETNNLAAFSTAHFINNFNTEVTNNLSYNPSSSSSSGGSGFSGGSSGGGGGGGGGGSW